MFRLTAVAGIQIVLNVLFGTTPKTPAEEAYVYAHAFVIWAILLLVVLVVDAVTDY